MNAAAIIKSNKKQIIDRWLEEVSKEIPDASDHREPILKNNIPDLLSSIVKSLEADDARNVVYRSQDHGKRRADETDYRIQDLIREYHLLREVIFDVIDENQPEIEHRERNGIVYAIDQAIEQASERFYNIRHTDKEKVIREGEELIKKMQEKDLARNQFVAGISHDLANPLTNTLIALDVLSDMGTYDNDSATADLLRVIKSSTQRANYLVNNILDIHSLEVGKPIPLNKEEENLLPELKTIIRSFHPDIQQRIEVNTEENEIVGNWDVPALSRAVENLISNALKHGNDGGKINVHVKQQNDTIISITNEGEPIAKEKLEKLFEPHYKEDKNKNNGYGLGLMVAKSVVEAHEGDIKVVSSDDRTTFKIILPQG